MAEGDHMLEMLANDILELERLSEREADRIIAKLEENEHSDSVPHPPDERFQNVSEEDCEAFIKDNENKNTMYKTKSDLKLFEDWKLSVGEERDLESIPAPELDILLARFFLAIRKRDGSEYEPGTLTSIQYSLDRYLKEKKVDFSIKKDSQFSHSNQVLASKRKNLKGQGKGNLKSKAEPLTSEEIQILREKNILGKADPTMLLQTVWLNNGVCFGMRGRQDHTNLLWGDVELKRSPDGREYLEFTERSTKTRSGAGRNAHREVAPKMFAKQDDELCPVSVYKEYRSRRPADMLNDGSRFYLQPLTAPKSKVWYSHQPVGKNKIGQFMKDMAEKADLEWRKVNHSTRKTFAQTLVEAGRPPTEVAHLGGWKSLQTINNYSTPSLKQQAKASDIISEVMRPSSSVVVPSIPASRPEEPSVLAEINNNLDASKSVSSNVSKQHSNPFAVLCGATISGGTFNINIVSGKRKFSDIMVESSQESQ